MTIQQLRDQLAKYPGEMEVRLALAEEGYSVMPIELHPYVVLDGLAVVRHGSDDVEVFDGYRDVGVHGTDGFEAHEILRKFPAVIIWPAT